METGLNYHKVGKEAERTDGNVVDVRLSGCVDVVITGHCAAVASQLGKHPHIIFIAPLLLRPSFTVLGRIIRSRFFSLQMLLLLVLVVGGCGGRCCSSLLGGTVDICLVQLAPQQSMKQARLLIRWTCVITDRQLITLHKIAPASKFYLIR